MNRSSRISDEAAYILPFATFLLFVAAGNYMPSLYAASYVARTVIVGTMLVAWWPRYTTVRWSFWWLGVGVGIIGVVQWVGMQIWLQNHFSYFRPATDVFDPTRALSPSWLYPFLVVRIAGATLVVPVMEELFWRDYLWRLMISPNFRIVRVGEWSWKALLIVSIAFSTVHGNSWLMAILWAMLIALLLVYTKSLGACIVAHAVTNLLLAIYVLQTQDWSFW
jgi:CAAX prenyl protease-like protein